MFRLVYFIWLGVNVSPRWGSKDCGSTTRRRLKGTLAMNWDRLEGEWKQRRGKAVHHWGKVMNDELAAMILEKK